MSQSKCSSTRCDLWGQSKNTLVFTLTPIHQSRMLAGLLLHGKTVKQTITTRANQCCLAAAPGVVG
jgi:hypothetical protein